MSKYLGSKCIICEQKFCENDDIVVCPECGTPYHRDCYAEIGECINKEYHISGKSWQPDKKIENKICPECGGENKPENINCTYCGAIIADDPTIKPGHDRRTDNNAHIPPTGRFAFDPRDKYCGMDPEEEFGSVKLGELADFVKSNQLYYLPIFKKIKDTGKKISLNITSFFFPEFYFANRKMWLWTAISIIVSTLLNLPYVMYMLANEGIINDTIGSINIRSQTFEYIYSLSSYANYAFKTLVLLFANWLYYRHAVKKINQQKKTQEQADPRALSAAGGTSIAGIFVSFSAEAFILMAIAVFLIK